MDGSQKLRQRLLATIAARAERGLTSPTLCLTVAAWMRWQGSVDDAGNGFVVDDPLADRTSAALAGCTSPEERVAALLVMDAVFPATLAADAAFRALGEDMGVLSHSASYWRYRFPAGEPLLAAPDELIDMLEEYALALG